MDVSLIRDDSNMGALRREPQVDLPLLGVDLTEDVEHIHSDTTIIPPNFTDAWSSPSTTTS